MTDVDVLTRTCLDMNADLRGIMDKYERQMLSLRNAEHSSTATRKLVIAALIQGMTRRLVELRIEFDPTASMTATALLLVDTGYAAMDQILSQVKANIKKDDENGN